MDDTHRDDKNRTDSDPDSVIERPITPDSSGDDDGPDPAAARSGRTIRSESRQLVDQAVEKVAELHRPRLESAEHFGRLVLAEDIEDADGAWLVGRPLDLAEVA